MPSVMIETKIEQLPYSGWPNCYRMTNGRVELIVTADVGPRIIRYGFVGGQNLFVEIADQLGGSREDRWMMRGGHRLWIAPEVVPDTYALDNEPVKATVQDGRISLLQPVEPETKLQKEISLEFTSTGDVKVTHRIENTGRATRSLAPWALTQLAPGGTAVTIFPPRGGHEEILQPTHPLVMWAYTDFSDARWLLTKRYLVLKQDPQQHSPQKAGIFNERTRAAYLLGNELFVKRADANPNALYPDFHCSFEVFTNGFFLELETLGPIVDVLSGFSANHVEYWSLHKNVTLGSLSESALDHAILPFLT